MFLRLMASKTQLQVQSFIMHILVADEMVRFGSVPGRMLTSSASVPSPSSLQQTSQRGGMDLLTL